MLKKLADIPFKTHVIIDLVLIVAMITIAITMLHFAGYARKLSTDAVTYTVAMPYFLLALHAAIVLGLCSYWMYLKNYRKFAVYFIYLVWLLVLLYAGMFLIGFTAWGVNGG